jgi:hypothetical protein
MNIFIGFYRNRKREFRRSREKYRTWLARIFAKAPKTRRKMPKFC